MEGDNGAVPGSALTLDMETAGGTRDGAEAMVACMAVISAAGNTAAAIVRKSICAQSLCRYCGYRVWNRGRAAEFPAKPLLNVFHVKVNDRGDI
jgi:hypothetical protein